MKNNNLQEIVATLTDLSLSAKMAHWNVRGPNFKMLHELFDEVYTLSSQATDDFAERMRQLDLRVLSALANVAKQTHLKSFADGEHKQKALLKMLNDRLDRVVKLLEESLKIKYDEATIDLITQSVRDFDKIRWMVRSHLE